MRTSRRTALQMADDNARTTVAIPPVGGGLLGVAASDLALARHTLHPNASGPLSDSKPRYPPHDL